MSIAKVIGAFGAGMGGYAAGRRQYLRDEEDRKDRETRREMDQLALGQARRKESDELSLRGAVEDSVVEDASAGPMPDGQVARVRGAGFGDMESAQAAATAADAGDQRIARRMGVLQAIDPMRAAQEKLTGMQVNAAEQDMADKLFVRSGARALMSGGWEGLAKHLSDSPADGQKGAMKFVTVPSADGKSVRIAVADNDGKPTNQGMDFTNDDAGRMNALSAMMSVTNPASRLEHYRWESDRRQKQGNWEAEFGLQTRKVADDERRTSIAASRGSGAGGGGGQGGTQAQDGPYWDDKADAFLREHYVTADEMTGAKVVDGSGMQFAKQVALARSAQNGGDLTQAMGYAFDLDATIRKKMGNDPEKVKAERLRVLRAAMARPSDEGASPQPTRTPSPAQQAPARQPGAAAAGVIRPDAATESAKGSWFMPTPKAGTKTADQIAAQQGFQPTSTRGNSIFGEGEVMYVNPKTGERRWASQFNQ